MIDVLAQNFHFRVKLIIGRIACFDLCDQIFSRGVLDLSFVQQVIVVNGRAQGRVEDFFLYRRMSGQFATDFPCKRFLGSKSASRFGRGRCLVLLK